MGRRRRACTLLTRLVDPSGPRGRPQYDPCAKLRQSQRRLAPQVPQAESQDTGRRMSHNAHMLMPNDDAEVLAAVRRYVVPERRYMKLHGWNIRHMEDRRRDEFGKSLAKAAAQASGRELIPLFNSDWRARLVAAWLVSMGGREEYRGLIKKLLLEGRGNNELKGFCFTLTSFGTRSDAEILSTYLSESLSAAQPLTAQEWALGGLLFLDEHLGTSYATPFIGSKGLWKGWAGAEAGSEVKSLVEFLSEFCATYKVQLTAGRLSCGSDPLEEYSSWRSRRLPARWQVLTSEAVRMKVDSEVGELLDDCDLPLTEPLSVAACENCWSILFNTRPGAGGWGIANSSDCSGSRIELRESFAEIWEFCARHSCC
ncbi:DUF6000 family protein [Streptomyces lydicus]|uniref:DUF6000 family protein n=1 Tax=Streptomyces lydicus TaxID=47763 RepID=UPI00378B5DF5